MSSVSRTSNTDLATHHRPGLKLRRSSNRCCAMTSGSSLSSWVSSLRALPSNSQQFVELRVNGLRVPMLRPLDKQCHQPRGDGRHRLPIEALWIEGFCQLSRLLVTRHAVEPG